MIKIVAFGSLREDITISYDYSRAMTAPETMLGSLKRTVGGSVYNTCRFMASKFEDISVVFCTYNYAELIRRVQDSFASPSLMIKYPEKQMPDYPTSIIGLKPDGEKQMLSFDPEINMEILSVYSEETKTANLIYTSMYEINKDNYTDVVSILEACLTRQSVVMVDLCPVIGKFDRTTVECILSSVSVVSGNAYETNNLIGLLGLQNIKDLFSNYPTIRIVCIKKGANGADLYERTNTTEILHLSQECKTTDNCAKNTTGCGDAFNAVVAHDLCIKENTKLLLEHAVKESGLVSKGGLPWTQKLTQN